MFTYIKLKNYKSFRNVELNLCNKKGLPRNIVLLYGENGCGKSNLVNVFYTMSQFFRTMQFKDIIDNIISNKSEEIDNIDSLKKILKSNLCETKDIIKESKTINSTENMVIELGFNIKGLNGSYYIETNDFQIVHEKLDFVKIKNKTNYFDIISFPDSEPEFNLNSSIILNKDFLSDTLKNIKKYAGKHSFLSLLLYERKDKQKNYFKSVISDNFYKVIHELFNISCIIRLNYSQIETGGVLTPFIRNLDKGTIPLSKKTELLKIEKALNIYLKNIVRDFVSVKYKFDSSEKNSSHYSLYLNRYIGSEIVSIPFKYESSGISSLLNLLPYFLDLFEGHTVIIDEMDRGIHDILFENILKIIKDCNNGQLILTLHNTNIMENLELRDNIYFIITNKDKTKEIKNVNDFNRRLYKSNNLKDLYFNATYGALPIDNNLNLNSIFETIFDEDLPKETE